MVSSSSYSQNQANVWYFGTNAGIDFNSGSPIAIANGDLVSREGSSIICNPNGNIKYYSNGEFVWDSSHDTLPNSKDTLNGCSSSSQSSIMVRHPDPDSSHLIFLFTVDCNENFLQNGLSYSVIDTSLPGNGTLANPLGDIVPSRKNILLFSGANEKVTAIKHANGCDYWVIGHITDSFYVYPLTSSGLGMPIIQKVGTAYNGSGIGFSGTGQLVASPNGRLLAGAVYESNLVELYDFDNSTGSVSNPRPTYMPNQAYGVSFSSDNTKLYASSGTRVFQFDLGKAECDSVNWDFYRAQIGNSSSSLYAMKLGPDNKIYISKSATSLATIGSPNNIGVESEFVDNGFDMAGNMSELGIAEFPLDFIYPPKVSFNICEECFADSFKLINTSGLGTLYNWDFGDGSTSTLMSPKHKYDNGGDYTIKIMTSAFCGSDSFLQMVSVDDGINHLDDSILVCPDSGIIYELDVNFGDAVWSSGDSSLFVFLQDTGTYFITYTDTHGCITNGNVTLEYDVCDYDLYLPNAITLFSTQNTLFRLPQKNIDNLDFSSISIYDKTGKLLFESNDKRFVWDGTYLNKRVSKGVYIYHLYLNSADGTYTNQLGNVTVLY